MGVGCVDQVVGDRLKRKRSGIQVYVDGQSSSGE